MDLNIDNLSTKEISIIVAFGSAFISAVVAIALILLNKYFDNRKKQEVKYDAVKKYANSIILSSEELAWRLKEILEFRGVYLLPDAPDNGFFKYKFDSTVYRLCKLLGWVQATKKEQSYIEGLYSKQHIKIQNAIINFQKNLADGNHIEVAILDDLIKLFNLKAIEIDENTRAKIGVELETIVFRFIKKDIKKNMHLLEHNKQISMLKEILGYICRTTNQAEINETIIIENKEKALREISREYCWIYRDWQSAIGDEMIKEIESANRKFDVIGFAEFTRIHDENEWIQKVNGLFNSLNVSIDDRFDSRVDQLKKLFESLIELIIVFKDLIKKNETILESNLDALIEFNNSINVKKSKKRRKLIIKFE